jgi:hypothetical protein
MIALTVTNQFADRQVGDTITDPAEMDAALASNPGSVVRVNLPDRAPAKAAAPSADPKPSAS